MRPIIVALGGFLVVLALAATTAARQNAADSATVRTIDVGTARPVLRAIEALRERYHVPITYEEPRYVYAQDLQDISYVHKGPVPVGVRLVAPRGGTIHFEYAEVGGKPQEGMTALIRRLVSGYAARGGLGFDVRERSTPSGPEWNVVAVRARDKWGTFVNQPDILGALVSIPEAQRSAAEFITEILQQVRSETECEVIWSSDVGPFETWTGKFSAQGLSARDALVELFSHGHTPIVWDMNHDPESDRFILTFIRTPESENVFPVSSPPASQPTQPMAPKHMPAAAVLHRMTTTRGRTELQSKLAQEGYYSGEPSGQWDEKTTEALKKFQAANNLPATGKLDPDTIRKLGIDMVTPHPQ
jgi:hypothetical protein